MTVSGRAQALVAALRRPRYEVLALPGAADEVAEHVPRDIPVTITASPRRPIETTIAMAEELARSGYHAVPHLAARQVADELHLTALLDRLGAVGVTEVFAIAGDRAEPVGAFPDSMALITAMARLDHGIDRIGVAGYPEGHPFIDDAALDRALEAKAGKAAYAVTQLCFDPRAVGSWVRRVREQGVELPVYVGMAGVVDSSRLLRIATRIGVGQSARFLRRHRGAALRLALPGAYRPDRLVRSLSNDLADPATGVAGLHIYTLGDIAATEAWRRQLLDKLGAARRGDRR